MSFQRLGRSKERPGQVGVVSIEPGQDVSGGLRKGAVDCLRRAVVRAAGPIRQRRRIMTDDLYAAVG